LTSRCQWLTPALGFLGEALGQRKDVPVEVKRRRPERKRGRAEWLN
jgi:hypothetical protein